MQCAASCAGAAPAHRGFVMSVCTSVTVTKSAPFTMKALSALTTRIWGREGEDRQACVTLKEVEAGRMAGGTLASFCFRRLRIRRDTACAERAAKASPLVSRLGCMGEDTAHLSHPAVDPGVNAQSVVALDVQMVKVGAWLGGGGGGAKQAQRLVAAIWRLWGGCAGCLDRQGP
jgi:hypothetical protein